MVDILWATLICLLTLNAAERVSSSKPARMDGG